MTLWHATESIDALVERFTVGDDRRLDLTLARYDVAGSLAHGRMLKDVGLLSESEWDLLKKGLDEIAAEIERGDFTIDDEYEDVHSKVEAELTRRVGDAGKKVHTARSRNDQVLLDMHLWAREAVAALRDDLRSLFERLMTLSDAHAAAPMPGYTHMQIAMPSSFGMWFGAYAEALIDDLTMLNAAGRIADQSPLGSAAGYGSSFPIDRDRTAELLGFRTLRVNAMGAALSRGKLEWTAATAMASVAATLGRFAGDVVLYAGGNFGFVAFPDALTTGSSIMPHKKNPDVFELIRARCNVVRALPNTIAMMTTNLPGGYHRDYQLLKETLFPAVAALSDAMRLAVHMLEHITISTAWRDDPRYDHLYTVEEVNRLVMEGRTFRDAYHEVGRSVAEGTYRPGMAREHTHVGSVGELGSERIREKFEGEWGR